MELNRGLDIEVEDVEFYNCGGYALNTRTWYLPYTKKGEMDNLIYNFINNNSTLKKKNLYRKLLKLATNTIQNEFPFLHTIKNPKVVKRDKTLIGFRVGVHYNKKLISKQRKAYSLSGFYDYDFHFILRQNGIWSHKRGGNEIEDFNEGFNSPWLGFNSHSELVPFYDSKIIWFVRE